MRRRLGPLLVAFIACVWLNQSVGLIAWEKLRYLVFTDPAAHVFDAVRYPFVFLYRRSADEAMYYGTAAQILGRPYDHAVFDLHSRGRVTGLAAYEAPPPPTDGHWHAPWTAVHLEYPPPVLPFVLLPKLVTEQFEPYAKVFGALMGGCMVLSIALAIDVMRRAQASRASLDARWWLAAGLLLAQGALTIQRLDPLVALAMIATLRGAVRRSPVEMGLWAGVAGACKILPLLVVPVILAADWGSWRTRLGRLGAWTAAGLAAGFGPMFAASPGAVLDFFRYHGLRGLQVESTLGALIGAVRIVLGTSQPATISYGSFNIDGAIPDALARLSLPLTVAGIGALCVREWRMAAAPDDPARIERLACATLAATLVLWLTGKVFSPQYLTWGIPLVLAIPGRRGVTAIWLAIAAFAATQLYYRGFYDLVFGQRLVGVLAVLVRQALLVLLLVHVLRPARSQLDPSPVAPAPGYGLPFEGPAAKEA
jgi:Glycosyltransferase family 87